jgi:protein-disulfide isomerase
MKTKILFKIALAGLIATVSSNTVFADAKVDKAFQDKLDAYLNTDHGREKVGKAIETYMQERQVRARKEAEERETAAMENQFKNPVKIDLGKSPIKGANDAKVTIVEFSDFQCPYCTRGRETMEKVLKEYPTQVRVVFKHLPLAFHAQAKPAAKAAWAAQQQGKFWEMHDEFFLNQSKLGEEGYFVQVATKLGLDIERFKKDMESPAAEAQVKEDMEIAEKNGIQGTPGFFVNGVAVKGAYPFEHFKGIIDRWLNGGSKKA